jgi:hypothetical protein
MKRMDAIVMSGFELVPGVSDTGSTLVGQETAERLGLTAGTTQSGRGRQGVMASAAAIAQCRCKSDLKAVRCAA